MLKACEKDKRKTQLREKSLPVNVSGRVNAAGWGTHCYVNYSSGTQHFFLIQVADCLHDFISVHDCAGIDPDCETGWDLTKWKEPEHRDNLWVQHRQRQTFYKYVF